MVPLTNSTSAPDIGTQVGILPQPLIVEHSTRVPMLRRGCRCGADVKTNIDTRPFGSNPPKKPFRVPMVPMFSKSIRIKKKVIHRIDTLNTHTYIRDLPKNTHIGTRVPRIRTNKPKSRVPMLKTHRHHIGTRENVEILGLQNA